MAKRDFYKLTPVTNLDVQFFEHWVSKCPPPLQRMHRNFFYRYCQVAALNETVQKSNQISDDDKYQAYNLTLEMEEQLHQATESMAVPILEELCQGCLGFLQDDKKAIELFHFIGHQYFRTLSVREDFREVLGLSEPGYDFSRLYHILGYCVAENIGSGLYRDRKRMQITFLTHQKNGFITGDQPIVNLDRNSIQEHDGIALYYPLLPNRAVIFGFQEPRHSECDVSDVIADHLNQAISFKSRQFLVGLSKHVLHKHLIKPIAFPNIMPLLFRDCQE